MNHQYNLTPKDVEEAIATYLGQLTAWVAGQTEVKFLVEIEYDYRPGGAHYPVFKGAKVVIKEEK